MNYEDSMDFQEFHNKTYDFWRWEVDEANKGFLTTLVHCVEKIILRISPLF